MGIYFLYRHIRIDTNEPFYVGVGKKRPRSQYERAYSKRDRNKYWKHIFALTEIVVEILFETDDRDLILSKEIEFISLYGRKEQGGTLVNMTDGGDGLFGYAPKHLMRPVCVYTMEGDFIKEFKSVTAAANFYKVDSGEVSLLCRGKRRSRLSMQWSYSKANKIEPMISRYESSSNSLSKPVIQRDEKGKEINKFKNALEAGKHFGLCRNTISAYCFNRTSKTKKIILEYG
jgi:hypothetical protein